MSFLAHAHTEASSFIFSCQCTILFKNSNSLPYKATDGTLTQFLSFLRIKNASINSRAIRSRPLPSTVVSFISGRHGLSSQARQWCGRWDPVLFFIESWCSLRRSLMQRPVCPIYTFPQVSGIEYTTPFAQRTNGVACFVWHAAALSDPFRILGHKPANLRGAEKTTGTPCLLATFFRLCATLWTYGKTTGFSLRSVSLTSPVTLDLFQQ